MQILKFKSQPTIAFFAAVNHLNGPLRKQNFTSRVQKVMVCDLWISIRFVCFCVSRFVACDHNYDWRQRKTQLWRRLLKYRVRMFVKSAVNDVPCSTLTKQTRFFSNFLSAHTSLTQLFSLDLLTRRSPARQLSVAHCTMSATAWSWLFLQS